MDKVDSASIRGVNPSAVCGCLFHCYSVTLITIVYFYFLYFWLQVQMSYDMAKAALPPAHVSDPPSGSWVGAGHPVLLLLPQPAGVPRGPWDLIHQPDGPGELACHLRPTTCSLV